MPMMTNEASEAMKKDKVEGEPTTTEQAEPSGEAEAEPTAEAEGTTEGEAEGEPEADKPKRKRKAKEPVGV